MADDKKPSKPTKPTIAQKPGKIYENSHKPHNITAIKKPDSSKKGK